jgi:hypothetical protein
MAEMVRVHTPGGWMAIYDEHSSVIYSAKLMRQYGLQIEKKTVDKVFGIKSQIVTIKGKILTP